MLRSLGQLAARELGLARSEPAASLAPRLPSRYEHADAAPAARSPLEPSSLDVSPVDIHAHADAVHASDRVSDTTPTAAPSTHADARSDVEAKTRVQRDSDDARDSHATTAKAIESADPSNNDISLSRPAAREPSQPTAVPPPRDRIQPIVPARDDVAATRVRKHDDAVTPIAERVHAQPRTPAREASALRPLAPPPLPARAAPSIAPAPPVHITIGRLEIRATKEPAATTAAAPRASATPSLAAYLRRRSDGGRS